MALQSTCALKRTLNVVALDTLEKLFENFLCKSLLFLNKHVKSVIVFGNI